LRNDILRQNLKLFSQHKKHVVGGHTKIARRKRDVPNNKEIPSVGPYVIIDIGGFFGLECQNLKV
jgi:hypothetical protein